MVLDSEGLLPLHGRRLSCIDGQITVNAMAYSGNHKGEISSQMKNLLEVCLYTIDYSKVSDMRPEMMFVVLGHAEGSHYLRCANTDENVTKRSH